MVRSQTAGTAAKAAGSDMPRFRSARIILFFLGSQCQSLRQVFARRPMLRREVPGTDDGADSSAQQVRVSITEDSSLDAREDDTFLQGAGSREDQEGQEDPDEAATVPGERGGDAVAAFGEEERDPRAEHGVFLKVHAVRDAGHLLSSFFQLRQQQHEKEKAFGPAVMMMRAGKSCAKFLVIFAFLGVCFVYLKSCCTAETWNLRRIPGMKGLLLSLGYDEFGETKLLVEICSAADLKGKGEKSLLLKDSTFTASVAFWYAVFETAASVKCDFHQSQMMTVPQGASQTTLFVTSIGNVSNSVVGTAVLNTNADILAREPNFYGTKQTYRLKDESGKFAGTLYMKFRRLTKEQEDNYYTPLIKGVANESGLGAECFKIALKLKLPDTLRNIDGELKCRILGEALQGKAKEVEKGVEQETMYMKVQYCSLGRVDFKSRKGEAKHAAKSGKNAPEKKFFFCVYESEKFAKSMAKEPVCFVDVAKIKKIMPSVKRQEEFTVKWEEPVVEEGKKPKSDDITLRMKEKDRDLCVEALDMLRDEVANIAENKTQEKEVDANKKDFQKISQASIEAHGCPTTAEDWKGWHDMMAAQGCDEDTTKEIYRDLAIYIENNKIEQKWKADLEATVEKEEEFYDPVLFWRRDLVADEVRDVAERERKTRAEKAFGDVNVFFAPPPDPGLKIAEVDGLATLDITGPPPLLTGVATDKGKGKVKVKGKGGEFRDALKDIQKEAAVPSGADLAGPNPNDESGEPGPDYPTLAEEAKARQKGKRRARGEGESAPEGNVFHKIGDALDNFLSGDAGGGGGGVLSLFSSPVVEGGDDDDNLFQKGPTELQSPAPFLLPKLVLNTRATEWPALGFTGWEQKRVDEEVLNSAEISGTDKLGSLFGFTLDWQDFPVVHVAAVTPKSRAASAGVSVGDILLDVNGHRIAKVIAKHYPAATPDDALSEAIRSMHEQTASTAGGKAGAAKPRVAKSFCSFLFLQARAQQEYVQLALLERDLGFSVSGNQLEHVTLGGWGGQFGLKKGDRILFVNDEYVTAKDEVKLERMLADPTNRPLHVLFRRFGGAFDDRALQHESEVARPMPRHWEEAIGREENAFREKARNPDDGLPFVDDGDAGSEASEQHWEEATAGGGGGTAAGAAGKKKGKGKAGPKTKAKGPSPKKGAGKAAAVVERDVSMFGVAAVSPPSSAFGKSPTATSPKSPKRPPVKKAASPAAKMKAKAKAKSSPPRSDPYSSPPNARSSQGDYISSPTSPTSRTSGNSPGSSSDDSPPGTSKAKGKKGKGKAAKKKGPRGEGESSPSSRSPGTSPGDIPGFSTPSPTVVDDDSPASGAKEAAPGGGGWGAFVGKPGPDAQKSPEDLARELFDAHEMDEKADAGGKKKGKKMAAMKGKKKGMGKGKAKKE